MGGALSASPVCTLLSGKQWQGWMGYLGRGRRGLLTACVVKRALNLYLGCLSSNPGSTINLPRIGQGMSHNAPDL